MDLAQKLSITAEKITHRVHELHEFNPMLGLRGCRLGITYPEITEMQARAVFEAAADVDEEGHQGQTRNHDSARRLQEGTGSPGRDRPRVAAEVQKEKKVKFNYLVGTMIEVPRGALTADEIAQTAEFFSFGTNDLTQTALGISRDDIGTFLVPYTENEIIKKNPFASIDQTGVGQLMEIAVEKGRKHPSRHQARHLRRTRRRSRFREILPSPRPRLRELPPFPRAGRAAGGGAGGCK